MELDAFLNQTTICLEIVIFNWIRDMSNMSKYGLNITTDSHIQMPLTKTKQNIYLFDLTDVFLSRVIRRIFIFVKNILNEFDFRDAYYFSLLRSGSIIWHQSTASPLVRVMARHLFDTKPLPESMIETKHTSVHSIYFIWKWHRQNGEIA